MRESNPKRGRAGNAVDVSPLDREIIRFLQEDGRRPYTQIAAALGLSEAAIRARVNRLVGSGILQVVGVADPTKLGYQQALVGVRCEPGRRTEVAEALARLPEVDYVVLTAGRYDVLIETVVEDNDGLLEFLDVRLPSVGGIRETEAFPYLRLVKQTYQFGTR